MPSSACAIPIRSEEHTSELQSHDNLVCRLLLDNTPFSHPFIAACQHRFNTRLGPACRVASRHHVVNQLTGTEGRVAHPDMLHLLWFFFNDAPTPEISNFPLHDALPI